MITTGFEIVPGYLTSLLSEISQIIHIPFTLPTPSTIRRRNFSIRILLPILENSPHDGLTLSATITPPANVLNWSTAPWLTFNTSTDTFSGTPNNFTDAGVYTITVHATNGQTGALLLIPLPLR